MKCEPYLQAWIPLVDFLADAIGDTCEVVLHDLKNIEHSIIAIRNSHITGRKVGDSLSGFALEVIQKQAKNTNTRYVAPYYGVLEENGKILRLSSFFIYDDDDNFVGLLALNMDFSKLEEACNIIDRFINLGTSPTASKMTGKAMHFNISESYLSGVVARAIQDVGMEPGRMTAEEKRGVVEKLQSQGVFLMKGSVTETAEKLEVSEQTVYRYLKDIEQSQ
jgi:predicted transcriptional regulator YheO